MSTADASAEDLVEVRVMLPRAALVQAPPVPELVSQASSLAVLGIPPRRFLELVRSPRFAGRVLRDGRLRLVRRVDLISHLESETEAAREASNDGAEHPTTSTTTRPTLADRLGLEAVRRAGARGR